MQFETNETGFTPGPWRFDGDVSSGKAPDIVTEGRTCRIAELDTFAYGKTGRNILANGRLIAAAPAMFEALLDIKAFLQGSDCREDRRIRSIETAVAALALAQGKPLAHPHDEPFETIELPERDPQCDTALDRDARNADALHNRPEEMP